MHDYTLPWVQAVPMVASRCSRSGSTGSWKWYGWDSGYTDHEHTGFTGQGYWQFRKKPAPLLQITVGTRTLRSTNGPDVTAEGLLAAAGRLGSQVRKTPKAIRQILWWIASFRIFAVGSPTDHFCHARAFEHIYERFRLGEVADRTRICEKVRQNSYVSRLFSS